MSLSCKTPIFLQVVSTFLHHVPLMFFARPRLLQSGDVVFELLVQGQESGNGMAEKYP